jgi:ankyrin repeat protein
MMEEFTRQARDHRVQTILVDAINAEDEEHMTPLIYAAHYCPNFETTMRYLIEQGADVNRRDLEGHTARDYLSNLPTDSGALKFIEYLKSLETK